MIKRVTVFKNSGDIEVHEVSFIMEAVIKMEPGEYAHSDSKLHWVHKFKDSKGGFERLGDTYNYVHELLVPEEYRLKMVLLQ